MGILDNLQHVILAEIYKNISSEQISYLITLCFIAIFVKLSGLHQLPDVVLREYSKSRNSNNKSSAEFELFEELMQIDTRKNDSPGSSDELKTDDSPENEVGQMEKFVEEDDKKSKDKESREFHQKISDQFLEETEKMLAEEKEFLAKLAHRREHVKKKMLHKLQNTTVLGEKEIVAEKVTEREILTTLATKSITQSNVTDLKHKLDKLREKVKDNVQIPVLAEDGTKKDKILEKDPHTILPPNSLLVDTVTKI